MSNLMRRAIAYDPSLQGPSVIDFGNPQTDIQDMLLKFKNFCYRDSGLRSFDVIKVADWLARTYNVFPVMGDARKLIDAWLSCKLIKPKSSDEIIDARYTDFRIYLINE